jgi:hypothetical protein
VAEELHHCPLGDARGPVSVDATSCLKSWSVKFVNPIVWT